MNRLIALDRYASPDFERVKLEHEWERFISGINTKPAIRPLMYQSWQRCLEKNINPFQNKTANTALAKNRLRNI